MNMIEYLYSNKFILYGVLPNVSALLGYLISIPLEILIQQSFMQTSLISYSSSITRKQSIDKSYQINKISKSNQFLQSLSVVIGIRMILTSILQYYILINILPDPKELTVFPIVYEFIMNLVLLEVIGDFFLYWGHRIQHEIPYLWKKFHYFHHQLDTPTPFGTIYIDSVDSMLQAGLPIIFAIILVRPHPITLHTYIFLRVAENVINHSGLDNIFLDILTLKILPFRAKVKHHDMHHKYSNYAANAKNYGENFWIWDYVFQTYRSS